MELMITVAVLAILAALAAPSFRETIQNNRLATQLNDFVSSLQIARSEAVKRGQAVSLCKSADGATCTNGGNWAQGWLVFTDVDGDGVLDAADGDTILNVGAALTGNNTLVGDLNVANAIRFDSRGFAPNTSGTLRLCDDRGATEARGVVVSASGRIRRTVDTNADDIEEDAGGNPLACP
ncbi:MAG: GspH/FimT family pseudopilin [Gammaproteobacteria bacterium]